ncbi:5'-Nucleotidase domain protein [Denitrovibrio acetiphilus DSM 12809]|uniref:5'-Nucleotidase domain protein n=1 Tax=Denitrovibrio acetiphilus (strain DSM 12809 / NBRC 114555 / N2460) TaxID=522772 RepID=D4H803_DENA2|nr:5'-nucleotidase C-terminal domain-containing protein [Denitrovibrio acetiphilus]ADD68152.1 5'-Nucleotidase domain protein [Denitrovibrio acetiphilus DSM 12809]
MHFTKLKQIIAAIAILFILAGCGGDSGSKQASAVSVRVIHTNDHHSYLESAAYDLKINDVDTRVEMGGFSRLSTVIQEERNDNSIVVNSGELSGTLYFSLFKGEPDFKVFNELALDGYTLGNHEFDEGDGRLAELIQMANFPILSSNMTPEEASPLYAVKDDIKPYIIKEIDGEKVGIIGILKVEKTKNSSFVSDDVTFTEEIEAANEAVAELEAQNVNKIILVSHVGYYNDIIFAQNVPGLDIIVGGDTHNLIGDEAQLEKIGLAQSYANDQTGPFDGYTHDGISDIDTIGEYPTLVTGPTGDPVYVVTAWCYARAVGILDVDFTAEGIVEKVGGNIVIPVSDTFLRKDASDAYVEVSADVKAEILQTIDADPILRVADVNPTIENIIAPYKAEMEATQNEVVGEITVTMDNTRIPTAFASGDTPSGSYAGQVVADAFKNTNPAIDVAIQNAGGVRASLLQGDITMAQIIEVLPFSNTVVMIDMKGSDIVKVLNEGAYYSLHSGSTGAFPYASGLRYDVNLSGGEYGVITDVEVQDRLTGVWSNIENDTIYTVSTNSFTAQGKDNYLTFAEVREDDPTVYEDTSILYYVPLVDYIKDLGILPALDKDSYCLKSVSN